MRSPESGNRLASHDKYKAGVITRAKEVLAELDIRLTRLPPPKTPDEFEAVNALDAARKRVKKEMNEIKGFIGTERVAEINAFLTQTSRQFGLPEAPIEATTAPRISNQEAIVSSEKEVLRETAERLAERVIENARASSEELKMARNAFLEVYRDARGWRDDEPNAALTAATENLAAAYKRWRDAHAVEPLSSSFTEDSLNELTTKMSEEDREVMEMLERGYDSVEEVAHGQLPKRRFTLSEEHPPESVLRDHRHPPKEKMAMRLTASLALLLGGAGAVTLVKTHEAPKRTIERVIPVAPQSEEIPEAPAIEAPDPRKSLADAISQFPDTGRGPDYESSRVMEQIEEEGNGTMPAMTPGAVTPVMPQVPLDTAEVIAPATTEETDSVAATEQQNIGGPEKEDREPASKKKDDLSGLY